MVMAAGTAKGHAKKGCKGVADHPIQLIKAIFFNVLCSLSHVVIIRWAVSAEPRGYQLILLRFLHLIAGELFANKLCERFVLVEAFDDIIPISPRIWAGNIIMKTTTVRVAGQIQPVSAPTLSVSR